ncbi:hypothetical protein J4573_26330 [Actinomadura barringtoniae]|uniref:HEAT repeat domain-containing protein n=1 Tax=Actinomadura barringtoniae TaxID=1427535 RepID=A0A939PIE6_9ACTN|nr:HEAT repeat domain-containing protein [Actinomadura barringtoniae]MBO2450648.1 hypothetical protein [Actinomadura barringtoniae]
MEIQALLDGLADSDDEQVKAASAALVELGAAAVGPVLAVLCDESSAVDWVTSAVVLRGIGTPALGPLTEAIAAAPTREVARRAGWAFSGLQVDDLTAFLPALHHPHPRVRDNAAYVFQCRPEPALPYAAELLDLLDDPDDEVRQRTRWALEKLGPEVIPLLQDRRRTTRGASRRHALEALAAVGGPGVLDERDLAVVRRLIRLKMRREEPEPMHLCGSWFALPTGDQEAVLDAFDLGAAEPVTMRLGAAAWNHDSHAWDVDHGRCSRVYVSPRLDGWTLIFGEPSDDAHRSEPGTYEERRAAMLARCAALSLRFGTAHWYGMSDGDGWTGWCVAEGGQITRYYDVHEPDEQLGPPHPAEAGLLLPHVEGLPDEAFDGVDTGDPHALFAAYEAAKIKYAVPDSCDAATFAARASVDPGSLGPHTRVEGHGVLALTGCGRERGHPRGALPI